MGAQIILSLFNGRSKLLELFIGRSKLLKFVQRAF